MFETVKAALTSRQTEIIGKTQVKVGARVEFGASVKNVLDVCAKCYLNSVERSDTDVRVSGKVVTRVIYLDETDSVNSEEHTDTWSEKFSLKNYGGAVSVSANAHTAETKIQNTDLNMVDVDNFVEIILLGITQKETQFVQNISGDAECNHEKIQIATLGTTIEDKFSVDEHIELDKNCEGILGVDTAAYLRDISCEDGRIVLKGTVAVNISAIRASEGTFAPYNQTAEFDFNKSVAAPGVGNDDIACGNITTSNVAVKVDNKTKPELIIEADLTFSGNAVVRADVEHVADAYSCEHEMVFSHANVENTVCAPQTNTHVDVEGNTTMPDAAPYIAKVLSTGDLRLGAVKIMPFENKITIDGVISANIIYECEEHNIHSHLAQITFTASVKADGMTPAHNVRASVVPVQCNIKARRGRELLVDARLALGIFGSIPVAVQLVSDVSAGDAKTVDESAIVIYLAGEKETLWDIAKRTSVPAAEIIKQNPSASEGIRAGERLVVYKQQVINF